MRWDAGDKDGECNDRLERIYDSTVRSTSLLIFPLRGLNEIRAPLSLSTQSGLSVSLQHPAPRSAAGTIPPPPPRPLACAHRSAAINDPPINGYRYTCYPIIRDKHFRITANVNKASASRTERKFRRSSERNLRREGGREGGGGL